MTNFIQDGDIVDFITPSGGYATGDLVVVGGFTGIAQTTTLENDTAAVVLKGVFSVDKETPLVIEVGDALYTDNGDAVNKTATSRTLVGYATEAALSAAVVVKVRLTN